MNATARSILEELKCIFQNQGGRWRHDSHILIGAIVDTLHKVLTALKTGEDNRPADASALVKIHWLVTQLANGTSLERGSDVQKLLALISDYDSEKLQVAHEFGQFTKPELDAAERFVRRLKERYAVLPTASWDSAPPIRLLASPRDAARRFRRTSAVGVGRLEWPDHERAAAYRK